MMSMKPRALSRSLYSRGFWTELSYLLWFCELVFCYKVNPWQKTNFQKKGLIKMYCDTKQLRGKAYFGSVYIFHTIIFDKLFSHSSSWIKVLKLCLFFLKSTNATIHKNLFQAAIMFITLWHSQYQTHWKSRTLVVKVGQMYSHQMVYFDWP